MPFLGHFSPFAFFQINRYTLISSLISILNRISQHLLSVITKIVNRIDEEMLAKVNVFFEIY